METVSLEIHCVNADRYVCFSKLEQQTSCFVTFKKPITLSQLCVEGVFPNQDSRFGCEEQAIQNVTGVTLVPSEKGYLLKRASQNGENLLIQHTPSYTDKSL
jgi:hypothetical protein